MDTKAKHDAKAKAILRQNLLILIHECTGDREMLAKRASTNANYLTQIINGHRNVGPTLARDLERAMSKPAGWMNAPHGDAVPVDALTTSVSVPILDMQAVLAVHRMPSTIRQHGRAAGGSVLTDKAVSEKAFAMRVEGDAMESAHGGRSFPMGARIIVDPAREPHSGEYVVARVSDDIYFRKLIIEGRRRSLIALNPAYHKIDLGDDSAICGVVVQAIVDL